jgi:hypothetical protein
VTCPKCGFQQDDGSRCERCGFLLARYGPLPSGFPSAAPFTQGAATPSDSAISSQEVPGPGAFRRFTRVFRWVALAVSLIALFLLLRPATPPPVRTDPHAAEHVQTKMEQMERAVAEGRPHILQFTEAELNVWMQSNLALGPGPATGGSGTTGPASEPTLESVRSGMRDIKVNLLGDRVRAYALFTLYGKDISLQLEGRLFVADSRLRLEPISGMLGSMPIPKLTLDRAVSRLFDSAENREKFLLPPEIKDIQVVNGELRVSYR